MIYSKHNAHIMLCDLLGEHIVLHMYEKQRSKKGLNAEILDVFIMVFCSTSIKSLMFKLRTSAEKQLSHHTHHSCHMWRVWKSYYHPWCLICTSVFLYLHQVYILDVSFQNETLNISRGHLCFIQKPSSVSVWRWSDRPGNTVRKIITQRDWADFKIALEDI